MALPKPPYCKYVGFSDFWLRVIGIPLVGFVLPAVFFGCDLSDWDWYWKHWLSATIYTFIYWTVDRWLVIYFRKRFPGPHQYPKRLLWTILAVVGFTAAFSAFSEISYDYSVGRGPFQELKPPGIKILTASLSVTVSVLAIYEAMYAVAKWKESLVESERLRKANVQAQLETLKNQVNPHFLFNSLNTLATIIPEDPEVAVTFVEKLSKVYRYILEIRKRELISLREELECIRAYGFLLNMRFGENLTIEEDIPPNRLEDHIVPLSLQILIENAIKHNVVSTSKPLKINISLSKKGHILVSNNLQKKQQVTDSTGTGLSNINSRYELLTGQSIEIITTQSAFRVVIPLVRVGNYEAPNN